MSTKSILIICIFILFGILRIVECQEWQLIKPTFDTPGDHKFYKGCFYNKDIGWIISGENSIYYTQDGGYNFTTQFDSSHFITNSVFFIDSLIGWISARKNEQTYLLRTFDGGLNWNIIPIDIGIHGFHFWDENYGIGYHSDASRYGGYNHGYIYYTENGGIEWQKATIPKVASFSPDDMFFFDDNVGYAIGIKGLVWDKSTLLKSTDMGISWEILYDNLNRAEGGISFGDSLHGCAVGLSADYTTDGGITWQPSNINSADYSYGGYDISFSNDTTAWLTSYNKLFKSTNSGRDWQKVSLDFSLALHPIIFTPNGICGYIPTESGMIYKLINKATAITQLKSTSPNNFDLYQNYPNPFNPNTRIKYHIFSGGDVKLCVYNLSGEKIKIILDRWQPPGAYVADFYSTDLSSGIYFFRLVFNNREQKIKKILLVK